MFGFVFCVTLSIGGLSWDVGVVDYDTMYILIMSTNQCNY